MVEKEKKKGKSINQHLVIFKTLYFSELFIYTNYIYITTAILQLKQQLILLILLHIFMNASLLLYSIHYW